MSIDLSTLVFVVAGGIGRGCVIGGSYVGLSPTCCDYCKSSDVCPLVTSVISCTQEDHRPRGYTSQTHHKPLLVFACSTRFHPPHADHTNTRSLQVTLNDEAQTNHGGIEEVAEEPTSITQLLFRVPCTSANSIPQSCSNHEPLSSHGAPWMGRDVRGMEGLRFGGGARSVGCLAPQPHLNPKPPTSPHPTLPQPTTSPVHREPSINPNLSYRRL